MKNIEGIKNLWAAVLQQAIDDYKSGSTKYSSTSARPTARDYISARLWLSSRKEYEPNSFIAVCRTLDLDPDKTRKQIFEKYGQLNTVAIKWF